MCDLLFFPTTIVVILKKQFGHSVEKRVSGLCGRSGLLQLNIVHVVSSWIEKTEII